MREIHQRGFTLAEAVISIAAASMLAGALLAAVLPAIRGTAADATTTAMRLIVDRELRVASDLLKYSGSSLVPATVATSMPLLTGSPLPITLQIQTHNTGTLQVQNTIVAQATNVTISASDASGRHTAQGSINVISRAPQPGTAISPAGTVPAPTGAP